MDRKGIIILVCALGLLLFLPWLSQKLFPPLPPSQSAPGSLSPVNPDTVTPGDASPPQPSITSTPTLRAVTPLTSEAGEESAPTQTGDLPAEEILELSNEKVRYLFTSHGGGLLEAELLEYPAYVSCRAPDRSDIDAPLRLNHGARYPVLAFRQAPAVEGNGVYRLSRISNGIRASREGDNGLTIIREFTLSTNSHLLHANVRIENRARQALQLPALEWSVGTATPMNAHDKADMMGVDWFNGSKSRQQLGWIQSTGFFCMPSSPRQEYIAGENDVVWVAVHNQFFALITLPDVPAQRVIARRTLLEQPNADDLASDPRTIRVPSGAETVMRYPETVIQPGEVLERTFTVYAGPKEYFRLSRLQPEFDRVMGYGFFGLFAKPLLLSMNFLHNSLSLPYGWCIVAITFLIKLMFWPLTAVSTRSMKRMQELAPQLQAIREKYKDDQKKLQEKTLEFMRQSGYNPVAGCLPIFVQIPVFIGFFTMLRSAIELRGAGFLWCCDLSVADTLFVIPGLGWLPLFGIPALGLPFNLMPMLYLATALWQTHMTPASPQMDPAQQRLFRWMPLMFLALFYNYSAGLTLYWTVQNLLTILQTKLTKTHSANATTSTPVAVKKPAAVRPPTGKKGPKK